MAQQKCISPEVGELYLDHMRGLLQGEELVTDVAEKLTLIAHGSRCEACRTQFNEMMSQQAHHLAEADSPEELQCTEPDIGNLLRTVLDGEGTLTEDEWRTRLPEHCAQCAACTHILRHWLPGDCSDPPTGAKMLRSSLSVEEVPEGRERVRLLLHSSQCEGCRSRLLRCWLADQLPQHEEPDPEE